MNNLDDLNDDDLHDAIGTFEQLASYCRLRLAARDVRRVGRVDMALRLEADAERIYLNLPEWAKWR